MDTPRYDSHYLTSFGVYEFLDWLDSARDKFGVTIDPKHCSPCQLDEALAKEEGYVYGYSGDVGDDDTSYMPIAERRYNSEPSINNVAALEL